MPPNSSILFFFVVGGLFLVVPLVIILFWNNSGCFPFNPDMPPVAAPADYCPSLSITKALVSFLPFLMVVGGVLIGYNLKRISDSYAPPKEQEEEVEQQVGEEGRELDFQNEEGQKSDE